MYSVGGPALKITFAAPAVWRGSNTHARTHATARYSSSLASTLNNDEWAQCTRLRFCWPFKTHVAVSSQYIHHVRVFILSSKYKLNSSRKQNQVMDGLVSRILRTLPMIVKDHWAIISMEIVNSTYTTAYYTHRHRALTGMPFRGCRAADQTTRHALVAPFRVLPCCSLIGWLPWVPSCAPLALAPKCATNESRISLILAEYFNLSLSHQ